MRHSLAASQHDGLHSVLIQGALFSSGSVVTVVVSSGVCDRWDPFLDLCSMARAIREHEVPTAVDTVQNGDGTTRCDTCLASFQSLPSRFVDLYGSGTALRP